jgi:post-segregation antitoxin (ccd killing protein)
MRYSVREPAYDGSAARQTVSLTINADLFARIKALGINASRVAEEALARELERHRAEQLQRDIKQDVVAMNAYVAQHGSFADLARAHYRKRRGGK